jgi:O-antigen ligase
MCFDEGEAMIWMICGYIWLFIHRPYEYWTFLGDMRIERIYGGCMVLVWAMYPNKRWISNRLNPVLAFFTFSILACWFASPYDSNLGETVWDDHFKIGVVFILLITTVHDEEKLKQVLTAYFVGLFIFQFHSFYEFVCGRHEVRMGIYRMKSVNQTFDDPNTFSASLLHALPFLVPFWVCAQNSKTKRMIVVHVLLTLVCIYLTGSRRAYLGVVVLAFLVTMRSKHRWSLFALYLLLAPVAFLLMRGDLQSRLVSIWDPSAAKSNAHTSAVFRWKAFEASLDLFQKNPLLGTGPATFAVASGFSLQAHNLYAQTLSEMGLFGIMALLGMIICFWLNSREVERIYQRHPWWEKDFSYHVGKIAWMAVILLLFMGAGGHNLFRYNWLWFAAFQMCALHIARKRAENELGYDWAPEHVPFRGYRTQPA